MAETFTQRQACEVVRPCRRLDLIQHDLDDEAFVFDPRSLDTHRLNETALFVWRYCDGAHALSEIRDAMAGRYDVDEQVAARHVQRLYTELDGLGLLEERLLESGEPE